MNENLTQINSLLRFFKEIMKDNKNLLLSRKIIYDCITKLDVSKEQYDIDIKEEIFSKFNNSVSSDYYISFSNNEEIIKKINTPIKVYIPLEYNHIYEGLTKILDFLNTNNIGYQAKLSKEIRIDNIIIRLSSKEDTNKLLDFIDNDEYIKNGLLNPNPFCFIKNKIGMTLDSNLSYTSIIVEYIYSYLKSKNTDEKVEEICANNFYNYVIDSYKNNFIDYTGFFSIDFPGFNKNNYNENSLKAYQDITELMLKISEKDFDEEQFYKLFDEYNNENNIEEKVNRNKVLTTFCSLIKIQGKKYGIENTIKMITEYINDGESTYITKDCSLRETVLATDFKEKLSDFLQKNNLTIKELVDKITSSNINIVDIQEINIDEQEEKVSNELSIIIDELSTIYTKEKAVEQLRGFIITNDLSYITTKNNLRQRVVDSNLRNNLISILYKRNCSFSKYLDSLNEKKVLNAEITFEQAIKNTYDKYNQQFESGQNAFDGYTIVNYAINQLFINDDFSYFTQDNDSRKKLKTIDKNTIFNVICNKLNYNNKSLSNLEVKDIEELIINYLDISLPKAL